MAKMQQQSNGVLPESGAKALTEAADVQELGRENARLKDVISELRTASPNVARLTDLAMWRERETFEDKMRRALVLLRKKDAKIRKLGDALVRQRGPAHGESVRNDTRDASRDGDGATKEDKASVIKRLEACVEEQAEKIEALLEEVVRLRSSKGTRSIGRDEDERPVARGFCWGSVHAEPSLEMRTIGEKEKRSSSEREGVTRHEGECLEESPKETRDRLHAQVAQLEAQLSAQRTALVEKEAEHERVTRQCRREVEEAHEREEVLEERVITLERLLSTARRTVLDREDRLRQAEASLSAFSDRHPPNRSNAPDCADRDNLGNGITGLPVAAQKEDREKPEVSPVKKSGVSDEKPTPRAPPLENELQEFFGVQEWWLHVVAAQKKCEESRAAQHGIDGKVGARDGGGGGDGKKVRRLRKLLQEQALEVVALRQTVLRLEMIARANARKEEKRAAESEKRAVQAEVLLKTEVSSGKAREAELEARTVALRGGGDIHNALLEAREELSANKLAVIRAKGDAELRARLLEEERKRSVTALSRAEDLQGHLDRLTVVETLRGIPGDVSALALIEHFAGRLLKQSRRVQSLEADVGNLRTRCARLASLARGEPEDIGGEGQGQNSGEWVEIVGIHQAKAAMEASRRQALEDEIKSLNNDVLVERQRTEAAQRALADDSRLRCLASNAGVSRDDDDITSLHRKLALASSEIEALRVHNADLRRRIRSGCWSWHVSDGSDAERGDGGGGNESQGEFSFPEYAPHARAAAAAALQEIELTGDGNCVNCGSVKGGSSSSSGTPASVEIARLNSLLSERDSQVSILNSTIEVLRSTCSFVSSPGRSSNHGDKGGNRGARSDARKSGGESSPSRVRILSHVGAQGLACHCVALTVRVASATACAGAAERHADRLAVELEQLQRKESAAGTAKDDLRRRNRALEDRLKKTAAALNSLRTESAAHLEEAAVKASKLRNALRDAELRADDARLRLESARTDRASLAAELQKSRERHREEILRLSDEHCIRLKESAERFFTDAALQHPRDQAFEKLGGKGKGGKVIGTTSLAVESPVVAAINELAQVWRGCVKRGDIERRQKRANGRSSRDSRTDDAGSIPAHRGNEVSHERHELAAGFLVETAVRLEAECCGAIRHARALEWELRAARRQAVDANVALEEANVEGVRLSARAAAAEAALISTLHANPPAINLTGSLGDSNNLRSEFQSYKRGVGGFNLTVDGGVGENGSGSSRSTVAAVWLLEKRHAAAIEDLISSRVARRAAEVGEAVATARAHAAEAEAKSARAAADVMSGELERHKSEVEDRIIAKASDWRREIRDELRRWWRDDLMNLHNGISLNWGSAEEADEIVSPRNAPASTISPSTAAVRSLGARHRCLGGDAPSVEVAGEEAMAQALIAGRAEQAVLEERLVAREQCLAQSREEVIRLRCVLERWHRDFVVTAAETQSRRSADPRQQERTKVADDRDRLEAQLLAATADLLGARDEVAGLRSEVGALKALVARLQKDEKEARETVARRVESASEIIRRRADGDLRDAADRLAEERERFKLQLGAAHADILRLGAEAADLERKNRELEMATAVSAGHWSDDVGETKMDGRVTKKCNLSGVSRDYLTGESKEGIGAVVSMAKVNSEKERCLLREAEEEREALRRMCNGLALDMKVAVDARAEAEDARELLLQEAAKSKAEAQAAGLAREKLEAALKELGRELEFTREAASGRGNAIEVDRGCDGKIKTHAVSAWDRSKGEARHFARVMVAAKVAEADLLRRLQDAAVTEADLRHIIRRRDIRIEELKREQATTYRLAKSSAAGTPWSNLASSRSTLGVREAEACDSGRVGCTVAEGQDEVSGGDKVKMAGERTAKEISQAAAIRRLELELAEATARREVGDAVISTAETLALRLFPKAGDDIDLGGVGCRTCGRSFPGNERPCTVSGVQDRGLSFLMGSVEVEKAAATAAAAAKVGAEAEAKVEAKAADDEDPETVKDVGDTGVADGRKSPVVMAKDTASAGDALDGGNICEKSAGCHSPASPDDDPPPRRGNPPADNQPAGITRGLRSLEQQLTRLETAARCISSTSSNSIDGGRGSNLLEQYSRIAELVDTLRELRALVAYLHNRAEITDQELNEVRARKDGLEEEAMDLRSELVRQRRRYWQATVMLKDRYEHALANEDHASRGPTPMQTVCVRTSDDSGDSDSRVKCTGVAHTDSVGKQAECSGGEAKGLRGEAEDDPEQVRLLRESLGHAEEMLQHAEKQLREVQKSHVKQAREVRTELARASDAHSARVETLEEQLRRARVKIKALARPKATRVVNRTKERAASAAGHGSIGMVLPPSPLSSNELLNMLVAADEEVFEVKVKEQRLSYELRVKSAEVEALRAGAIAASNTVGSFCSLPTAPTGKSALDAVLCAARLASAEAEVERLRHEVLVAREATIGAQREMSAMRLESRRPVASRSEEGQSREKELRRQLAAYKREVNRLRSTTGLPAADGAGNDGCSRRAGEETMAEPAEGLEAVLSKTRAQLNSAREDSERRGRTIVALRAAKTSLVVDVDRLRREMAEVEAKLDRALKDAGVKGSAVKALRVKVSALEAEIEAAREAQATERISRPANASECSCYASQAGLSSPNAQDCVIRELRAERDRLRKNMRIRRGSLSKQAAEIDAKIAEIERLEMEVGALRAAAARKDGVYRTTKKQLDALHEEHEQLKVSIQRWKADADEKWSNLKRASEAAAIEANVCRQSGDAAGRELASLKSTFRSFLKTLWEDLRPRLPFVSPAGIALPGRERVSETLSDRDRGILRLPEAPPPGNTSEAPRTMGDFRFDIEEQQQVVEAVMSAPGATPYAQTDTIAELTEAEILDIMQALGDIDPPEPFFMSTPQERTLAPPSGSGAPATSEPSQGTRGAGDGDACYARAVEGLEYGLESRSTSTVLGDMLRSLHPEDFSDGRSDVTTGVYSMSPHLPLLTPRLAMEETAVTSTCINDGQVLSSSKGGDALERWSRQAGEMLRTSGTGDPVGDGFCQEQGRSTVTEASSTSPPDEIRDGVDS